MRKLIHLIFLAHFAMAQVGESPSVWYAGIKAREDSVSSALKRERAKSYENSTRHERKIRSKALDEIEARLQELQKEIRLTTDKTFLPHLSDDWKNVLQQARALQDINHENLIDLRDTLKLKPSQR